MNIKGIQSTNSRTLSNTEETLQFGMRTIAKKRGIACSSEQRAECTGRISTSTASSAPSPPAPPLAPPARASAVREVGSTYTPSSASPAGSTPGAPLVGAEPPAPRWY